MGALFPLQAFLRVKALRKCFLFWRLSALTHLSSGNLVAVTFVLLLLRTRLRLLSGWPSSWGTRGSEQGGPLQQQLSETCIFRESIYLAMYFSPQKQWFHHFRCSRRTTTNLSDKQVQAQLIHPELKASTAPGCWVSTRSAESSTLLLPTPSAANNRHKITGISLSRLAPRTGIPSAFLWWPKETTKKLITKNFCHQLGPLEWVTPGLKQLICPRLPVSPASEGHLPSVWNRKQGRKHTWKHQHKKKNPLGY